MTRRGDRVGLAWGVALCGLLGAQSPAATLGPTVRARLAADAKAGRPLVAHIVVALCDNQHQGIVRVPKHLGNGQDPRTNLYWGARYGLKTYFRRDAGWKAVPHQGATSDGILERIVLTRPVTRREGKTARAYVVADAWDGRKIRTAIDRFLRMAGGSHAEIVRVQQDGRTVALPAGASAHVIAYIGHNGLMDFALPPQPAASATAPPKSAIVLACASKGYFETPLKQARAHPLLLTTGLMAPEAYTLDAALQACFAGATAREAREAAAKAYHRFQKCGLRGARRLFCGAR